MALAEGDVFRASRLQCHGHNKADAVRMKQLIEQYQTQYYRAAGPPPAVEVSRG